MKCLHLAVVVVLLSICVLHCTAVPYSETLMQEKEKSDAPLEERTQTVSAAEETSPLELFRAKRQSHISLCRYCCKCCRGYKGCGYCCRF
ncbi:hypothetical protein MATL_G00124670 [Megalops atlanticus]|uniref:Hepcidin n=1 Tax=Megalops atlanticus TaxID=7932 RepID=A0A9D3T3E6_MEGAT|nr:hypothetical protein MATL_G00124670 [Megalops atlanticus]